MNMTFDEAERLAYMQGLNTNAPVWMLAEKGQWPESIQYTADDTDIQAGFPSEDCLDEIMLSLFTIIQGMHGNNKAKPELQMLTNFR